MEKSIDNKYKFYLGTLTPTITEERKLNVTQMDVFSRLMADRIIYFGDMVYSDTANTAVAQLLFLNNVSETEPINFYINSPGGYCSDGLAIYDTIKLINAPVYTTCIGECASMGAILLAAGEKGHRRITKHSKIMIHQPIGGYNGCADDAEIYMNELLKCKDVIYGLLSDDIGKPKEQIIEDSKRDRWFTAEEALEYGIVDEIL